MPSCERAVEVKPPDSFRPFCSERCRLADLASGWTVRTGSARPSAEEDLDQGQSSDDTDSEAQAQLTLVRVELAAEGLGMQEPGDAGEALRGVM